MVLPETPHGSAFQRHDPRHGHPGLSEPERQEKREVSREPRPAAPRAAVPRRAALILAIAGWVMGCSVLDQRSRQELEAAYGPNPPGWQAAYAVDAISPGRIWHIYLKGADPDGDLRFVHVWLNTSGRSSSPIRLPVDPDQNLSLSGYLILETSLLWDPGRDLFGRWLSLWVTLEDRADHRSEPREFPLRFYYGAPPGGPPPGVFEERFLGRIPLELIPRDDLDEDFHHFPYRRWR